MFDEDKFCSYIYMLFKFNINIVNILYLVRNLVGIEFVYIFIFISLKCKIFCYVFLIFCGFRI